MNVLVNFMDKMTIHLSRLTIEYYVLKKNGYNHNFLEQIHFLQLYQYIILHIFKTSF